MRFNKTIFLSLGVSLALPLFYQAGQASDNVSVVSRSDKSSAKNEGRKISMSVPGLGTAVVTVTPAVAKASPFGKPLAPGRHLSLGQQLSDKKDLTIATKGSNITMRVPASVDAAIADAQVISKQISKCAANSAAGVGRVINMIVLYFRQWTGPSTITPGGYPYVEKSVEAQAPAPAPGGHKLYCTAEGRLKTVVSR